MEHEFTRFPDMMQQNCTDLLSCRQDRSRLIGPAAAASTFTAADTQTTETHRHRETEENILTHRHKGTDRREQTDTQTSGTHRYTY